MQQHILFLTALCGLLTVSSGENKILNIVSDPSQVNVGDGPQMTLDAGLRSLESNTTLLIYSGNHIVPNLIFVRDVTGVIIQGVGSAQDTDISCLPRIGLAFFNIVDLQIRNVTINRCGLNQESWDQINSTLYDSFDMVFEIPRVVRVGILLAACRDVTLENFAVVRTQGIGLLAMSLLGSTQLRKVRFRNNSPPNCSTSLDNFINQDYHTWIGGGAYFLYQDLTRPLEARRHSLTVDGGQFIDNMDCSITVLLENYIERSVDLTDLGYQVGAGGGLSVMMVQLKYTVSMDVIDTTFDNNVARNGGGVHVGVFSGVPPQTTIRIYKCLFKENGVSRDDIASSGGGMIINIDLVRPSELRGEHDIEDVEGSVHIDVSNSKFEENNANSGGGVAIVSHYAEQHVFGSSYQAYFHRCIFEKNHGFGGAALLVYERKGSGFDTGLQLFISDSTVRKNSIELREDSTVEVGHIQDYGAVHVRNVNLTLSGMNLFEGNLATALGAVSALINVRGEVRFERNRAVNGAAMQLILQSLLVLKNGANIMFIDNRVDMFGGAIFVQMNPDNFTLIPDDCFLYFNEPGYGLCTNDQLCLPDRMSISVTFKRNKAHLGAMVFGSALNTCPWLHFLRTRSAYDPMLSVYENLHRMMSTTFSFDRPPDSPNLVSTETSSLHVEKDLEISVMPGEQFYVNISAMDAFRRPVPEVITSNVVGIGPRDNTSSVIGDFGFFQVKPLESTHAPITVLSQEDKNITIRLASIDFQSELFLRVEITACVVGFTHSDMRCVCDDRLMSRGVSCNTNFTVNRNTWLGPIHEDYNITNDDLTVAPCVLDYCEEGVKDVRSGDWDSQCREGFHRSGLLCGRCADGYSVQLGTNSCGKCTNWSIFLLIFFAVAGIFVVFMLGLLQISVAEGFFVAIIFYSNIISLYTVHFNNANKTTGINFLTSHFSLNFGIEACLYDGMDSLTIMALQLVFVVYIFILAVLRILIDKHIRFKWMDSMDQKYSPSKLFATLIIVSYVSILQASCGILSFTVVSTFDNDLHVLWYIDPTVPYFQGLHSFLGIVALVLLLLFILPLPILLTFCSRAIYRWRYFNKFKPLYDALYAPFKVKFRPWLGFQLIVRIVLFLFAYFAPRPHQLLALGVCLVVYFHVQTICQPYNSKWANLLESTLMGIALFYVITTLYFGNLTSVDGLAVLLTVTILSTIAYCLFIAGFVGYLIQRNPICFARIRNIFKRKNEENGKTDVELSSSPPMHPKIRVVDSTGNEVTETPQHRAVRSASVDYINQRDGTNLTQEVEVSYTEFREPLLDEGELEVNTSYSVVIAPCRSPAAPRRGLSPANIILATTTLRQPLNTT